MTNVPVLTEERQKYVWDVACHRWSQDPTDDRDPITVLSMEYQGKMEVYCAFLVQLQQIKFCDSCGKLKKLRLHEPHRCAGEAILKITEEEGVTIIGFLNDRLLDEQLIDCVGECLLELVLQGTTRLILDFGNIYYLSARMVGWMKRLHAVNEREDGKLVSCALSPQIYEDFEVAKLTEALIFVETEEEGLALFNPSCIPDIVVVSE